MKGANWMQETIDFISKVGFPVFVAGYLLIKIDPLMKKVIEVMSEVTTLLKEKNGK